MEIGYSFFFKIEEIKATLKSMSQPKNTFVTFKASVMYL